MKPVKNIMLNEMLRLTQSFCTDHLAVFLNKFELKSAQLRALGTSQTAADVLTMTQLPQKLIIKDFKCDDTSMQVPWQILDCLLQRQRKIDRRQGVGGGDNLVLTDHRQALV